MDIQYIIEKLTNIGLGTELEGFIPRPGSLPLHVARAMLARKLASQCGVPFRNSERESYFLRQYWAITPDSSIAGETWAGNYGDKSIVGAELKSPVLVGIAGLQGLQERFSQFTHLPIRTNGNCGLHFHVSPVADGRDLQKWDDTQTLDFMQNTYDNYMDNISFIERLVDPARHTNEHCMRNPIVTRDSTDNEPLELTRRKLAQRLCPKLNRSDWLVGGGGKNYQLNLDTILSKGTVEFRLRQAEDYEESVPFAGLCMMLVAESRDGIAFNAKEYAAAVTGHELLDLTATIHKYATRPAYNPQPQSKLARA